MWWCNVVSFSFGFRSTYCRIRSLPWCTRAQFRAWCVVEVCGFPLGEGLRSTCSAGCPLFAVLIATMPSSDFSIPYIIGYDVFRLPYAALYDFRAGWRHPRSRYSACMRPWVLGHRGPVIPLTIAMDYVLPSIVTRISATQTIILSVLNSPGHMCRCQRFTSALTNRCA